MAIQAQFQNPNPYFQNNLMLEDFQPQIIDCARNYQSNLTNYRALVSSKRVRGDDSMNSLSGCINSDIVLSNFHNYSLEIGTVIRAQNQKLKLELEQIQYKWYQDLFSTMKHRLIQILQIKVVEYESLARNNQELEEKIRQISKESQIWYNVMKDNESKVTILEAKLDNMLNSFQFNDMSVKEGYGDSDETALAADDATSLNYVVEGTGSGTFRNATKRWLCRMCMGTDVSVLVLPCRHLCLCTACESVCDTCPVCGTRKEAPLQVLLG